MLVKNNFSIFFLFFPFFSFSIFAQQNGNDSLQIVYSTGSSPFSYKNIDTTLSNLIFYQPNSSFTNFSFNSGNLGLSFCPLYLNYNRTEDIFFRSFDGYLIKSDSVRYYKTTKPYTEFVYTQGLTKEHLPAIFHTQRLNQQMGVTLNYRAISSEGTYPNQRAKGQSFFVAIDFHSKDGRYLTLLDIVYNSLSVHESGGLKDFDLQSFQSLGGLSSGSLLSTNLNSATNTMNHKGLSWKNYWFCFGKRDSVSIKTGRFGIFNELNFTSSSSVFAMIDSIEVLGANFNSVNINSKKTQDVLRLDRLENFVGLTVGAKDRSVYTPQIKFGYKHQFNNLSSMNSGFLAAELSKQKSTLFFSASALYGLFGRRLGDTKVQAQLEKNLQNHNKMAVNVAYSDQKPSYFDDYFFSNHHAWNNNFENIKQLNASLKFYFNPIHLLIEGGYQNINNFILFDLNSNINQVSENQNISFISLFHSFSNKWLRTRSYMRYQLSSELVRSPELLARQEIAILMNHKAIHAEIGLLGTYVSNFYANSYDPSLRDYYLQNKRNVGGVVLLDFFAALRVGSAKLYFKVDHFNAGVLGYNYELIPSYPQTGLTFKLGIKWTFWN